VGEFIGGVAQQGASEPSAPNVWIEVGVDDKRSTLAHA
jgi:hypothetical protein